MNTLESLVPTRAATLRYQLSETRLELHQLAVCPFDYINEIRVSREHAISYMETMLAQERRILRELNDCGYQRTLIEREAESSAALKHAAAFLRGVACQPSEIISAPLRTNLQIAAKAAEIALR